ncbi:hypothetical protein ACUL41_14400 [Virgibacillus natechei]|uniref:hypothetical protein n=1 Tax=Virgibacillus sp. CBA3643 TaxID=2942278 RepID=UPI0035A2DCC0
MKFEDEVLKLLGEMNQKQNKFESELAAVKEQTDKIPEIERKTDIIPEIERKTDIIHKEVISLREDMTMSEQKSDGVEKEQAYQFTKWAEHDRRIDKLERKSMS